MNYTTKPATPAGLTYPILQETIDLSSADFTKLNTSPIQILPNQSNNICPINTTIQYTNTGGGTVPINYFYIGFESQLSASSGANAFYGFDLSIAGTLTSGKLTGGPRFDFPFSYPSNTTDSEPLVIWSVADDINLAYSKFIVTITYIRILNL